MAHTEVTLTNDDGTLVPGQPSVPVADGDTVAFSINDGSAFLFFSPDAAAILSPAPVNPVKISSSGQTVFTFTSSEPGAYSVFFEEDDDSVPAGYPVRESNLLLLEIDSEGGDFGGPSAGPRDAG